MQPTPYCRTLNVYRVRALCMLKKCMPITIMCNINKVVYAYMLFTRNGISCVNTVPRYMLYHVYTFRVLLVMLDLYNIYVIYTGKVLSENAHHPHVYVT